MKTEKTFPDSYLKVLKGMCEAGNWPIGGKTLLPLLARLEAHEALDEWLEHTPFCILSFWEAGEPTSNGYRTKIKGKWYESRPNDNTPKCNCGLGEKYEAWLQSKGEAAGK